MLQATAQLAVDELASCQAADGYLAPWADERRWSKGTWDTWGQYHCMLGCLLWADSTGGDPTALRVATKIADCICSHFVTPADLVAQGGYEQNSAILHAIACLYTKSRNPKLLDFCNVVLEEMQLPETGPLDFMRNALAVPLPEPRI
eukprot:SAG31_NODE_2728_length_5180_cov_2.415469_4_plen_147_part_00